MREVHGTGNPPSSGGEWKVGKRSSPVACLSPSSKRQVMDIEELLNRRHRGKTFSAMYSEDPDHCDWVLRLEEPDAIE